MKVSLQVGHQAFVVTLLKCISLKELFNQLKVHLPFTGFEIPVQFCACEEVQRYLFPAILQ
jgi:hypothetical protein